MSLSLRMLAFLRDLRYSLRSLSRSPALTAALLVTVAVGIGTHTTITAFIDGLLTRNLGLPGQDGLAAVYWRDEAGRYGPVPYATYLTLAQGSGPFQSVAAFRESRASVTIDGRTAWMPVGAATDALWDLLRVPPALGLTTFARSETADPPIVISSKLWRDQFGAQSAAIGAAVVVSGHETHVAGVLPEWFEGIYVGRAIDVWVPQAVLQEGRRPDAVSVLARMQPAMTIDGAQSALTEAGSGGPGMTVLPYLGIEPDVQVKFVRARRLLQAAAALVFLTAVANVAAFLLSRAARRAHETAARVALGATQWRLAAQIAADSVVIAAVGGALGGLVAFWAGTAMPALFYSQDAEQLHLMPDIARTALSVGAYTAMTMICGLAPLGQIRQHGTMATLRRSESASATSIGWLRSALVVVQIAVCVVLVIATGLLLQAFRQALRTARADNLGHPVIAVVEAAARFARADAGAMYFRNVEHEVRDVPGVLDVAWVGTLPGGRPSGLAVRLEQAKAGTREMSIVAELPEGKALLGMDLIDGRAFGGQDGPGSCRVALVNEAAAEEYFAGSAVGRSIEDGAGRRIDIVGVVRPKREGPKDSDPRIYFYERQSATMPPRGASMRFLLPVAPADARVVETDIDVNPASPGYFAAAGASVVAGTGFNAATDGCDVAVINREAALLYFGGRAVGGAVIDPEGRRARIVGVVDDGALRVMQRRTPAMVYFPASQRYAPRMTLIAAAAEAPPAFVDSITRRIRAIDGGRGDPVAITLDEHLARTSLGPERIAAVLVAAAAATALGLGLLGAYGVMSDSVRQRKREIALRLALGAPAPNILGTVFRDGLRIAFTGAAVGLATSWLLVGYAVHVNPDAALPALWMWPASLLLVLAIVVVASILPARWALTVDPLTITRES